MTGYKGSSGRSCQIPDFLHYRVGDRGDERRGHVGAVLGGPEKSLNRKVAYSYCTCHIGQGFFLHWGNNSCYPVFLLASIQQRSSGKSLIIFTSSDYKNHAS